ncbi:MAG: DUF167 domain-containing protein [Dehalococcoidia bacterium]|nr:DUF167 domain-containing protein [Dehalococcoidia bacterium]
MRIQIRVKTNAKTATVEQDGDRLVVKVKEPPKENKANEAIIRELAKYFHVSKQNVRILRGIKSRSKVVEIITD